ncbi:MAG: DUF424 domain-containing protein [Candidatus Micrarchaeota archaeon]
MIKAKIHTKIFFEGSRQVERKIVAICDSDLLGKVFEQGERVLDLQKYRSFYEGEFVSEKKVGEMLKDAANINLVGEKAIIAAGKVLKIEKKSVLKIKGVPHLQIYRI